MKNKITIIKDLKSALISRFGDNIKEVILFGSQASGEAEYDSDYDILIILRKKPDWKYEREISNICYTVDLKHDIITDTHYLSESEINLLRGKQPIFINALKNGIYA